jgi:hypothetical protein
MVLKDEDEDDKDRKGEQLSILEDQPEQEGEVVAVEADKAHAEPATDERMAQGAEEEEGDHPGLSDAEREARRVERRARKDREKAARDRNKRELEFLRKRNEDLERRFSSYEQRQVRSEAAIIDDRVAQLDAHIQQAEQVHALAISKAQGEDAVEAQRIRDQLIQQKNQLLYNKQQIAAAAQAGLQQHQPQAQTPEPVSPDLLRHASEWQRKNSWYKPDKSDQDSMVTGAIDDRLVAEGFDPETEEYWDELTSRVKQVLPHHFQGNGQGERRESRGPAMANGGRSERALRPGEVYVSPERKQAMMEAGVWDDPKLRTRYLKRYQQYDREHANDRRA